MLVCISICHLELAPHRHFEQASHRHFRRLAEDQILSISALADFCAEPPMLLGDAALAALAALPGARLAPLALRTHHAVGIARAAEHFAADAVESDLLVPVYLQKSQAEQTRLDAEKKN